MLQMQGTMLLGLNKALCFGNMWEHSLPRWLWNLAIRSKSWTLSNAFHVVMFLLKQNHNRNIFRTNQETAYIQGDYICLPMKYWTHIFKILSLECCCYGSVAELNIICAAYYCKPLYFYYRFRNLEPLRFKQ